MTRYAWGKPGASNASAGPTSLFNVAPGTPCPPTPIGSRAGERPTLIRAHGLEPSDGITTGSPTRRLRRFKAYVSISQLRRTSHLSDGLYHSGLTNDPLAVMRELIDVDGLAQFAIAGYSLGGNLTLKLAGDFGARPPKELRAICAVSPTMDLAVCVGALEERQNAIYQWHFVRNLKRRMRRKARAFPGKWSLDALPGIRSIRAFDDTYTAPFHGFQDCGRYYHRASAMRVIDKISVPALIITAVDDPFVPPAPFTDRAVAGNRNITVMLTPHGGHCGFVEEARDGYDGYWAEREIVAFLKKNCAF